MALRRPCPMFLLPLILLAVGLSLGSGQTCVMKNRIFQRHHVQYPVIFPRPKDYCDKMMRMRQIYGKPLNTFIHAPIQAINRVCSVSGTPIPGGLHQSKGFFSTTTCRYNLQTRSYDGTSLSRRIIIGCCKGLAAYYRE